MKRALIVLGVVAMNPTFETAYRRFLAWWHLPEDEGSPYSPWMKEPGAGAFR